MKSWHIQPGKVENVLPTLPANSFDAVLCDPPYGYSFMGSAWDYKVPRASVWTEVLRVLKPGAPLIAFSGPRTYHRMAVEVEDGGFEIRDMLSWFHAQGFPKSHDVSKALDDRAGAKRKVVGSRKLFGTARIVGGQGGATAGRSKAAYAEEGVELRETLDITEPVTPLAKVWQGYGTALKPAHEPAVLARKPLEGTMAENVAKWGVGGLAIDASRIGTESTRRDTGGAAIWGQSGRIVGGSDEGRWPANLMLDPEAGAMLDAQSGERRSTLTGRADPNVRHDNPSEVQTTGWLGTRTMGGSEVYADSGGASRFFYCAKPSEGEREGNNHPTVKPIALMQHLAGLLLPPGGGTILVPYAGSGSEMIGALRAGWGNVFGIEWWHPYIAIAKKRLERER